MKRQEDMIFREVQRPRQIWLWAFVLLFAAFMWFICIKQVVLGIPVGDKPAPDAFLVIFWLLFGVGFPLGLFSLRLVTEVRADGLYLRYVPFHYQYRPFLWRNIGSYQAIEYNSYKRFGGVGIRINFEGETCYNVGGTKGIELRLINRPENVVVIGSRDPERLIKAIDKARQQSH